jgi:hypothetical protein
LHVGKLHDGDAIVGQGLCCGVPRARKILE